MNVTESLKDEDVFAAYKRTSVVQPPPLPPQKTNKPGKLLREHRDKPKQCWLNNRTMLQRLSLRFAYLILLLLIFLVFKLCYPDNFFYIQGSPLSYYLFDNAVL